MLRSKKHREFVALHECLACKGAGRHSRMLADDPVTQACHVNYLGAKHGKPRGLAEKVDDIWTAPLCMMHHFAQSRLGQSGDAEREWWDRYGVDPEPICLELARNSPDPKVREFADAL